MNGYVLEKFIQNWAPKEISWPKDNVGLQVGNPESRLTNILISLEINQKVIEDAIKKKCNYIITHHPLLFQPLKKIDLHKDKNSRIVHSLITNNITLISAHTNLDFTKDGVSFQLAKKLGLQKISFLVYAKENRNKLVIFTPKDSVKAVSEAVFNAGGGKIGENSNFSFMTEGTGTFLGSGTANRTSGKAGSFCQAEEVRLEFIIDEWNAGKAIAEMKKVHPYEEPAYDIYPLKNKNENYGAGAIGFLEKPLRFADFLDYTAEKLNIKNFRYCAGSKNTISKVALCGGAGSEMLWDAVKQNADSFITADVKYHTFQDAQNVINMIDAGHYETEVVVLDELKKRLEKFISENKEDHKVFRYKGTTNPIFFHNK
jgi:dinuclear metal center YbgI/SA1388 family protein